MTFWRERSTTPTSFLINIVGLKVRMGQHIGGANFCLAGPGLSHTGREHLCKGPEAGTNRTGWLGAGSIEERWPMGRRWVSDFWLSVQEPV